MSASNYFVIVRVFVEEGADRAAVVADRLHEIFGRAVHRPRVEPYYKEPGWQEIRFWVEPPGGDPQRAIAAVADALGEGWTTGSDGWTSFAVWSPGKGALAADRARFANLEIHVEDQPSSLASLA